MSYGRMIYVGPWLFRGGKNLRPQTLIDPRGQSLQLYDVGPVRGGMPIRWHVLPDPRGLSCRPVSWAVGINSNTPP